MVLWSHIMLISVDAIQYGTNGVAWLHIILLIWSSAVAGFLAALIQGDLNTGDFAQTAVLVFGASQAIYSFILKGTPADKIMLAAFGGTNQSVKLANDVFAEVAKAVEETKKTVKKAPAKKAKPKA